MGRHGTSVFGRCRGALLRKDEIQRKSSRRDPANPSSLAVHVRVHQDVTYEDDCVPLLDRIEEQSFSISRRRPSPRRQSSIFTIPSWCRLFLSTHFTTLTLYLFLTLLLFTSLTSAAPITHVRHPALVKRQAVPDRNGNTGNQRAPVASQPPPRVVTTTEVPASTIVIISTNAPATITSATSTIPRTPSSPTGVPSASLALSLTASTIPVSSLEANPTSTSPAELLPPLFTSTGPSPTNTPSGPGSENQLQRVGPETSTTPAAVAGIAVGGIILIALITGTAFILYRRKKAREIAEIPIRRSKMGSRMGRRIFGNHYDDSIAKSRGLAKFTERSSPPREFDTEEKKKKSPQTPPNSRKAQPPPINVSRPPMSPSIYSPDRLARTTRISTMTFGSVDGWLDRSTIGRPQPTFMGTPSQLLDAPKPLFTKDQAKGRAMADGAAPWVEKGRISPPRPMRPISAEPLGRLSGMGYGLGMMGKPK
ncbi:hypothetical protein GQ44DRAFT_776469 [Phaeosphaeriaceae sp. PMI808]|nr:hypothetical protein GQ44DRAFT_776469 [Phaeosphaeriaceae sp. PMI808]